MRRAIAIAHAVGALHAEVRQRLRQQALASRVRRIRGVVQHAELEVDGIAPGSRRSRPWDGAGARGLVDRGQVRARLHLHHGVALAVEHVHVLAVLQERRAHGQRLLVVEHGAVAHVRLDVGGGERVLEQVGVGAVHVVHDLRDHDVADAAVEGGGLAHDVDPEDLVDAAGDRGEVVIGRHAQRVVDVDHQRLALAQLLDAGHADPLVEQLRHQPRQLDDLGVDVDAAGAGDRVEATVGVAGADLVDAGLAGGGLVDVRAQRVVEDVGRGAVVAGGHRAVVVRRQALGVGPMHHVDDRVAMGGRVAAAQVGQRVAVRRDEVDRTLVATAHVAGSIARHQRLRRALVLAERAVEQPERQVALVALDVDERGLPVGAQRGGQGRQPDGRAERGVDAHPGREIVVGGGRQIDRLDAGARAACSTRSGRR